MNRLTSSDGTTIAFDLLGDGPPVILVCGGSTDRTANAGEAELLAEHFTVFNYDRRGRGDSGDKAPYAVEREVEDIDAVLAELAELGVEPEKAPYRPGGRDNLPNIAFISDPDGYRIELIDGGRFDTPQDPAD